MALIHSGNSFSDYDEESPENSALLVGQKSREKETRWGPVIQLVILSVAYMLGYAPHTALMNLEGVIQPEIGLYAMMCLFGGALVNSVLVSPILTRKLGAKGCVLCAWVCETVFICAHFYVEPYILLPVSFFAGIGHGQGLTTAGVFITALALQYVHATGQSQDHVMGLFNGIFFTIYLTCSIWSNLISSLVLVKPASVNATEKSNLSELCGPKFCPWEDTSGTFIRQPDQNEIYITLGGFLCLVGSAFVLTLFFVKKIKPESVEAVSGARAFWSATGNLLLRKKFVLLVLPFMMYSAGEVFIIAEFTKAFVSCELGIEYNGWTMIAFAVGSNIGSIVTGRLVKYVGWPVLFVFAACCNFGCYTSMLVFDPSIGSIEYFFLVPFVCGVADSVWISQSSENKGDRSGMGSSPLHPSPKNK
ncbi:protein unc-93 homolog A-like [Lingula anatina]|uniref:Protein unc-93 homolog A-like n=1 Tax=Lingula anatina TaxID=7574 RepID=A0A1S3HWV9_LINAN|nr:protein unc-93 homolog A-like [Lingula anatina]|eukprot:XP_013390503.2 protein unc-93 homolog A-like [Lingula anatina]